MAVFGGAEDAGPHISQMWLLSLRLAFLSMLITVGLIALIIPG
jgi:hypothetical protein